MLLIVVGQEGQTASSGHASGGGGGATFVLTPDQALIVAGGGGGGFCTVLRLGRPLVSMQRTCDRHLRISRIQERSLRPAEDL